MMKGLARSWLWTAPVVMMVAAAPAAAQFSDGYNFLKAVRDRDVNKAREYLDKPGNALVNTRDGDSGETALMLTIKRRDLPWTALLLQNGADSSLRDRNGDTALIMAVMTNFPEGVRMLLAGKARVNGTNNKGETPLIKAVQRKNSSIVRILLDSGADPDIRDNLAGMSARDYAAQDRRSGQIAEMLDNAPKNEKTGAIGPVF